MFYSQNLVTFKLLWQFLKQAMCPKILKQQNLVGLHFDISKLFLTQVRSLALPLALKALAPWILAPWPLAPRSLVKVLSSYSRNRSSNAPTSRPLTAWWARSRWRRSLTRWRARSRSSGRFRVARSPGTVARSRCWPRPRRGRNSGMGFPRHRKLETWLKNKNYLSYFLDNIFISHCSFFFNPLWFCAYVCY